MSITRWVTPAATFLESTEAIIWPALSKSNAFSTRIRMSSAGLRLIAPPQAMQPFSRSITVRIALSSRFTGARTSIVSAVPAGDVMAREEVLGMTRPKAAQIATMMGVERLPGKPPTECLSAMMAWPQARRLPVSTMAWVMAMISPDDIGCAAQAVIKADISMEE